ncbi:hypothetical protein [Microlunatus sp. GCM10028923]|uniref:hypothetical protein n=1 Tax=Microlunatus sp. GCM10028923 TaxID=3273400 RepID=UPI003615CC2C
MQQHTLVSLIERHGIDVNEHLDRDLTIPVLAGMQRQGDLLVVPVAEVTAKAEVPDHGTPVAVGGAGGHAHTIVADGPVRCDLRRPTSDVPVAAVLFVPEGSVGWLAHPEHAYLGIAPGSYEIRRQREQPIGQPVRLVED